MRGYWYSRWFFERGLALIYLIAFLAALNQFIPLAGERGLLPAPQFLQEVPFRYSPSLFHWFATDRAFRVQFASNFLSIFAICAF